MSKIISGPREKISRSEFFVVLSTKNYLKCIRNADRDIMSQIDIARELNKPFFIIKDRRLSQEETEEIDKYFSKDNIIHRITVDMGSNMFAEIVASEIRKMVKLTYPHVDKIDAVTPYPLGKD